jgi:CheY-like chemotaxis protein
MHGTFDNELLVAAQHGHISRGFIRHGSLHEGRRILLDSGGIKMFGQRDGQTILLGEDDLEVRGYLETALKRQGYAVEAAQDGEEVLSALENSPVPISAIILDVILPRKDGIDTLKEIRRIDRVTPVIMVAATADSAERDGRDEERRQRLPDETDQPRRSPTRSENRAWQ